MTCAEGVDHNAAHPSNNAAMIAKVRTNAMTSQNSGARTTLGLRTYLMAV